MNNLKFKTLTKETAIKVSDELIRLHNLIPFQNWDVKDLLSEYDEKRIYNYKWEISSICYYGNQIVGLCITFFDKNSQINNISNFLYLHRIVVKPEFREKSIGRNLIKHSCGELLKIDKSLYDSKVLVLTPIEALNNCIFECAEDFYLRLGFNKIGEKEYPSKIDAILTRNLLIVN